MPATIFRSATSRALAPRTVRANLPQQRVDRLGRTLRTKSRTWEQEQGINTLFATFGSLKWRERGESTWRFAPILLLPLKIEENVREGHSQISATGDDREFNQTLAEMLQREFQIPLSIEIDEETGLPPLFEQIRAAIAQQPGWEVVDEVHVGTFPFHKLRMFKDRDEHAAIAADHPIIKALATEGATVASLPDGIPAPEELDRAVSPRDTFTVLDADSSQLWAIQAAVRGSNLIIQGPPGTGKSQTIANIIAECLANGKTILFVSEKAAAIEVVHSRLKQRGLGDFCLALHSQKANKLEVVRDLAAQLESESVGGDVRQEDRVLDQLQLTREQLNAYPAALHRVREPLGLSVFDVYGRLAELGDRPDLIVDVPQIATLTSGQLESWQQRIADAAQSAPVIAAGPDHVWAGFARDEIGLSDRATLRQTLMDTRDTLADVERQARQVASTLALPEPATMPAVAELRTLADLVPGERPLRADWLDLNQASRAKSLALEAETRTATTTALRTEVFGTYSEAIFATATSEAIASYESGWWSRLFSSEYKQARAAVRAAATDGSQRVGTDELATLRRAAEASEQLAWFREQSAALTTVLDIPLDITGLPNLKRLEERREHIASAAAIAERFAPESVPSGLVDVLGQPGTGKQVEVATRALGKAIDQLRVHVAALQGFFDPTALMVENTPLDVGTTEAFRGWLVEHLDRMSELDDWLQAQGAMKAVREAGLDDTVKQLNGRCVPPDQWRDTVTRMVLMRWLDHVYQEDGTLKSFRGPTREQDIERFRSLDQRQIDMAAWRIRRQLAGRRNGLGGSTIGEPGTLRKQALVKRPKPLRWLFQQIPLLLPTLKPCLMMSPLSVAQYLPADRYRFDVVIFDEASQVRPHDAIGSIMRGKQLIVAGDQHQLPPSFIFEKSNESNADDDDQSLTDMESILNALSAKGMPPARLLWHYRSRHEDLIAFSNHHIYDRRLITFPSPGTGRGINTGVRLEYVQDGVYDIDRDAVFGSTTERVNRVEARRVVNLVMDHARSRPDESLGVVALGGPHRDVIDDLLLEARRASPELEGFFDEGKANPFFVKALEQVQGDERDVIMISIGYGKNAKGVLSHNFGPINREGGERRLNVLVTRARDQIIVVSSIRTGDIDLTKTQKRGPQLLREYLDFAERGKIAIEAGTSGGDGEFDSPFEASVCAALEQAGHTVRRQVGASKYRIDLAIVDPRQPGRHLLGIECDGATYHSAKTARDRDRLRQENLEKLGWTIHRVWSTDWIRDPQRELRRLIDRIQALLEASTDEPTPIRSVQESAFIELVGSIAPHRPETKASLPSEPVPLLPLYRIARLTPASAGDLTAAPVFKVAELVAACVAVEGPIHRDLLTRRIREAWGHGRGGARIVGHVSTAIQYAIHNGQVRQQGEFVWPPIEYPLVARGADEQGEPRKIGQIAPEELTLGMTRVLERAFSLSGDDLIAETARAFGNLRTGSDIHSRLTEVRDDAVRSGTIEVLGTSYSLPKR